MRRTVLSGALLLTLFLASPPAAAATGDPGGGRLFRPAAAGGTERAEILVRFRDGVTAAERRAAHLRSGALRGRALRLAGWEKAELPAGADPRRVVARFRSHPGVAEAEVVLPRRITRFPKDWIPEQWAFHNSGQIIVGGIAGIPDADIDAPEAWDLATGSRDIVVAVLDTGIDHSRGDLSKRLVPGFDLVNNDAKADDDQGHGTAVASVIGAIGNNTNGFTGLNWKVSLMPVKVCDAGGFCHGSSLVQGIGFAVAAGADVINMSLSCDEHEDAAGCNASNPGVCSSSAERQAIEDALAAGVVVVAAAGNCGRNVDDATRSYPCAYGLEGNICVGATDWNDQATGFSNFGSNTVDLGAPGDLIPVYGVTPPGGAFFTGGTSFASPMVAGAAALLLSRTTLTAEAVRERLMEGADPGQGLTSSFEEGRLNLFHTVRDVFRTGRIYGDHAPGDVTLLADITGNGRADLVRGISGVGFELAKNRKRKFRRMRPRSSTPPAPFTGAGDANGDGREDLILGDGSGFHVIAARNKKGKLLPVETWSAEALGAFALVGDVNGDFLADVINVRGGTFDALLSDGLSFTSSPGWATETPGTDTFLADASGDGLDDLILWNRGAGQTTIAVGISTGSGFGAASTWAVADELAFAAAGDFDADGDDDLAGSDPSSGCLVVLLADGGAYEDPRIWTCAGDGSHFFAGRAGKNRDMREDLVMRQSSTGSWLLLEAAR